VSGVGSPWSDPETVTYTGPPVSAPPQQHPWAPPAAGWPPAPYWPAYGPPVPARPRRPGQVVAAAVLAFVQAVGVALTSAYLLLLASTFGLLSTEFGGDSETDAFIDEAVVLTVVQLLSAVALVVGGILVLNRRARSSWTTLVVAFGVQLALALYWVVRLSTLGGFSEDVVGPAAVLVVGVLFFTAAPGVGVGLLLAGAVRRWSAGADAPARP